MKKNRIVILLSIIFVIALSLYYFLNQSAIKDITNQRYDITQTNDSGHVVDEPLNVNAGTQLEEKLTFTKRKLLT